MNNSFPTQLKQLRKAARLTNEELARLADVPESLLSGLQTGSRKVGEYQARKIGTALKLKDEALKQFIFSAINTCSEKVLSDSKGYPAELLNLIALQLRRAGVLAESICGCKIAGNEQEQNVTLDLRNGKSASLKTQLVGV